MSKTVRDAMTPQPLTVDADASIERVARQMRRWDVRQVLVTDRGRYCGVLTDSDIIVLAIASGRPPSTVSAGEACDPDGPRLAPDQPTGDAIEYMRLNDQQHLPVVDRHGRLVGVAWIDDLLAAHPRHMVSTGA